jgi:group I intron endonuclease
MNLFLPEYDIEITMPTPLSYIYCITNTVSGKHYIGQTKNIKRRIENHVQGKGSKPLLKDIVKQGISDFQFNVLEMIYDDRNVDVIEDGHINRLNCLHPQGYNLRVNATIVANGEVIDLNEISIQGKFCFQKESHIVFSVGEFTQARGYQILANIKASTETTKLKQKRLFGYNYFEIKISSDRLFYSGDIHDLTLKYNFHTDTFTL